MSGVLEKGRVEPRCNGVHAVRAASPPPVIGSDFGAVLLDTR